MKKIVGLCIVFILFFAPFFSNGQQQYFRVINGLPHLPVFTDTGVADGLVDPIPGMLIFSVADASPLCFWGAGWINICNSEDPWKGGPDFFQIYKGIPVIPVKKSFPGTSKPGMLFYSVANNSVMVADGKASFHRMSLMHAKGAGFADSTIFSSYGNNTRVFSLPVVTSLPASGVEAGAICIEASSRLVNFYDGRSWHAVSCDFFCGANLKIEHLVANGVAPVNKVVTYGTVDSIPGEEAKCWITKNLGADNQASSVSDATEQAAGWYWQANRLQGYRHTGSSRTPSSAWSTPIDENVSWLLINDPCVAELGEGWRIPTYSEWYNVDDAGNWLTGDDPWNSDLKLHAAGYLEGSSGNLLDRGTIGSYASGSQGFFTNLWNLQFSSSYSTVGSYPKECGFSVRCINDPEQSANAPAQPGPITGTSVVCYFDRYTCYTYSIAPVAGASDYSWEFDGTGRISVASDGLSCDVCSDIFGNFYGGTLSVSAKNDYGSSFASSFYIYLKDYNFTYGKICQLYENGISGPILQNQIADYLYLTRNGATVFLSATEANFEVKLKYGQLASDLAINLITGQIDVDASVPGTYEVCYIGDDDCTPCTEVEICVAPEYPLVSYGDSVFCAYSGLRVPPTVNPSSGGTMAFSASPSSLAIDSKTGVINVGASSPGTYVITCAPDADCCPDATTTTTIKIVDLPQLAVDISREPDCRDRTADVDLTITGTDTGSETLWTVFDTRGITIQNGTITEDGTFTVYGLSPGVYTFAIFNYGSDCGSQSRTLTIDPPSPCAICYVDSDCDVMEQRLTICIRELLADPDNYVSGSWMVNINGNIEPLSDICSSFPISKGQYTVRVFPEGDPGNYQEFWITVNPLCCPLEVTSSISFDCRTKKGDVSICVNRQGATSYDWSLKQDEDTVLYNIKISCTSVENLAPGNYTFTIIDNTNLSCPPQTVDVTVECRDTCICERPYFNILFAPDCEDKIAYVNVENLPAYAPWTLHLRSVNDDITVEGSGSTYMMMLPAGTYSVTVTSLDGCVSETVELVIPCPYNCTCEVPTVAIMRPTNCLNKTADIVVSNLPKGKWTINPGNFQETKSHYPIYGLTPGTHSFTVTDEDGCSAEFSIMIPCPFGCTSPTPQITEYLRHPSCDNKTAEVELSNLPKGDWTINPGGITGSDTVAVVVLRAGVQYTVTNDEGCVSGTFEIPCPQDCNVECSNPSYVTVPAECIRKDGELIVNPGYIAFYGLPVLQGKVAWKVSMNGGDPVEGNPGITSYHRSLYPGTYTFVITDVDGAVLWDITVTIEQPDCPCDFLTDIKTSVTVDASNCSKLLGTITISGLPPVGWSIWGNWGGLPTSGSGDTHKILSLSPGTYVFWVSDKDGCTTTPVEVTIPCPDSCTPDPDFVVTDADCDTQRGRIVITNMDPDWIVEPDPLKYIGTDLPPGTYSFSVKSRTSGCTFDTTVVINCPAGCPDCVDIPKITIARSPDCKDKTADIYVENLPDGNWTINPGGYSGTGATTMIKNLGVGTYKFTVTNNDKCCTSDPVTLVIECPPGCNSDCPAIEAIAVDADCENGITGSIMLTGLPVQGWIIHPWGMKGTQANYTIPDLPPGTYVFTIEDMDGNRYRMEVTIKCKEAEVNVDGGDDTKG